MKNLETKLIDLENRINVQKATIEELESRIRKLESSEKNTGVYTAGCPEYVRDYLEKSEKKVGE